MSIAIHIPFYNQEPYKKEGFKQLTRFDYLLENTEGKESPQSIVSKTTKSKDAK